MIHYAALLLYIGAFALWVRVLWTGSRGRGALAASILAALAVAAHGGGLALFTLDYGELPLVGPGAALSTLAFVGGVALLLLLPLREVARVGIVLLPFVIVLEATALLVGIQPAATVIEFEGPGFILHVTFAFMGFQALALAGAAGVLYLIQFHELKTKRLGKVFQFVPPLATLDVLGKIGVWVGFACLTLSLALAWAWTLSARGSLEMTDPKVIWSVLSWFVFLAIMGVRWRGGRPEHWGAVAAVVGFGLVAAVFVVLRVTVGAEGLFL